METPERERQDCKNEYVTLPGIPAKKMQDKTNRQNMMQLLQIRTQVDSKIFLFGD